MSINVYGFQVDALDVAQSVVIVLLLMVIAYGFASRARAARRSDRRLAALEEVLSLAEDLKPKRTVSSLVEEKRNAAGIVPVTEEIPVVGNRENVSYEPVPIVKVNGKAVVVRGPSDGRVELVGDRAELPRRVARNGSGSGAVPCEYHAPLIVNGCFYCGKGDPMLNGSKLFAESETGPMKSVGPQSTEREA